MVNVKMGLVCALPVGMGNIVLWKVVPTVVVDMGVVKPTWKDFGNADVIKLGQGLSAPLAWNKTVMMDRTMTRVCDTAG